MSDRDHGHFVAGSTITGNLATLGATNNVIIIRNKGEPGGQL
ncbi:hypothetical protein [Methanoregula sp.]|nr:hypothetical protein [Methanoregula sp.]